MSDIQDKINQILSNPEALKQVQSLGAQLGLAQKEPVQPPPTQKISSEFLNDDMLKIFTKVAPLMQSFKSEDDTTHLLNALRPFLCEERREKLDKAEKMLKILKVLPLLKDNGLF